MFATAGLKLLGVILFPIGLTIILCAWLGFGGMGAEEGMAWLAFLDGSLFWAIVFTLVGGFITSLGVVMARA